MEIKIWEATTTHVQASVSSVFYFHAHGAATPKAVLSLVTNLDRFVESTSGPIGYIFQVDAGSTPPSAPDRNRLTSAFNRNASRIGGLAIVIEARGFIGAAQRAATTAVFSMYRQGFDTKTFDNTRSAAEWIAEKQSPPTPQILSLFNTANARLDAIAPPDGA